MMWNEQNLTEERICIQELKKGSRKAFNVLYRMYCARLYAFAYKYTKSKEDVEEIVQDAFTKLWVYRETIQHSESVSGFLFQVIKNQLINRFRSVVNSPVFEEYVVENHEAAVSDMEQAARRLEFEEFRNMLLDGIRKLPATQQKVAHCRLFEDLTPPETARKLQLSEQTVRNQFSLALKSIRKYLLERKASWVFVYILYVIKYQF